MPCTTTAIILGLPVIMLTNLYYCLVDPTQALAESGYYKQLESCQLLTLVSTTVSHENVTFPSCINSTSCVNTTHGIAMHVTSHGNIDSMANFGN